MEGYIALSRVTSAEGLVIAQPFAPTLFRQGPAPYPTLLLQVLKGGVSQLELEEKLKEIENTTPEKLLKNISFKCGACAEHLAVSKFIRQEKNAEAYLHSIIRNVVMLGACAICLRCSSGIDLQVCFLCKEEKDRSLFVPKQDTSDKSRCLSCTIPRCSNTQCPCPNPQSQVDPFKIKYLWPQTKDEVLSFRCLA